MVGVDAKRLAKLDIPAPDYVVAMCQHRDMIVVATSEGRIYLVRIDDT